MFDLIKIVRNIELKGFYSAFEAFYDSDFSFDGERHDFWEVVYVIDGKIGVAVDGKVYTLSANEIIFHKPLEFHKLWSEDNTTPRLFIFSFSAEGEMLERFKDGVFRLNIEQKTNLFQFLGFLRQICSEYNKDKRINDFLTDMNDDSSHIMANYLELFFLSMNKENNAVLDNLDNKEAVVYNNAIKIMEERVTENISVSELASECLVSESYLKSVFSKYTGLGVHKYFLKLKINYTMILLRDGVAVTEMSDRLSFSSQNYFSMVFKRETGMTPTEYRNRYK